MLRIIAALLVGAISLLLVVVTAPKLYEMFQIKGWIPGGRPQQVTVTAKWHQNAAESEDSREVFWVAWNGRDITKRGQHRANMFPEQWAAVNIGDRIEIVYIPWSDDTYLKEGIYVSFGNFAFDVVLLILELLGIYYAVRVLREKIRTWRGRANA